MICYLEKLNVKYIFRLQTKMYEKGKASMEADDEWIELNVAGDRLRKIKDEEIKKELRSKKTLQVRMSKIILEIGEIEYLLTNIPENIIEPEEMKETYFNGLSPIS